MANVSDAIQSMSQSAQNQMLLANAQTEFTSMINSNKMVNEFEKTQSDNSTNTYTSYLTGVTEKQKATYNLSEASARK